MDIWAGWGSCCGGRGTKARFADEMDGAIELTVAEEEQRGLLAEDSPGRDLG